MKLIVKPHSIEIKQNDLVNEKEIDISKCEFEFVDIPNDYTKEAYFTFNGNTYKQILVNNECKLPSEVLVNKGQVEIGCVCFKVDGNNITRYNPSPVYINTLVGSLKQATNTEPITPTDKEQIEQIVSDVQTQMNNLDITAQKQDKTTTIIITKKDGTTETTQILDGEDGVSLQYNWVGTSLGIKREDEQNYDYVNLKGDKGDAGAIEMIIVNELPSVGNEGTIYLVPYQEAETGNIYKEYIYVNNAWEELGSIPIEVDLSDYYTKEETNALIPTALSDLTDDSTHRLTTDTEKNTWNNKLDSSALTNYVQNTDYASASTGGVIKRSNYYGLTTDANGVLLGLSNNYSTYTSGPSELIISKGTLENVITGKDLTTKAYVDSLVGDIETILTTLDIGGGI